MKYFLTLSLLVLMIPVVSAQDIVSAEYFFDADPGVSKGTPLSVGTPSDTVSFASSIQVPADMDPGLHTLYIRTKDSNGVWSLGDPRVFRVKSATDTEVVSGEFFFDSDSGQGKGSEIAINTKGAEASFNSAIPLPFDLSEGIHIIQIRVLNRSGRWSHTEKRVFRVKNDSLYPIVMAEYYFDSVPILGEGIPIPVESTTDTAWFRKLIDLPQLTMGTHKLFLRVKDSKGRWSILEEREITVCETYGPLAGFTMRQDYMLVTFKDTSLHATQYHWDFGDGSSDTVRNPVHLYTETGIFTVCLTVTNACGTSQICQTVVIEGIESIEQNKGGQGGRVSPVVTGYGFVEGTTIYLVKSNDSTKVILPDTSKLFNDQSIFLTLDLADADTGYYDVIATFPDGPNQILERGFEVVSYKEPKMKIKIIGYLYARTERFISVRVQVINEGNVDAYLVPVHLYNIPGDFIIEEGFELVDAMQYEFYSGTLNTLLNEGVDSMDIFSPRTRDEEDGTQGVSVLIPSVPPGRPITSGFHLRASEPKEVEVKAAVAPPLIVNKKIPSGSNCFGTVLNCAIKIALEELLSRSKWDDCAKALTAAMDQVISDVVGIGGGSPNAITIAMGGKAKSGAISDILSNKLLSYGTHAFKLIRDCGPIALNLLPAGKIKRIITLTSDILTKGEKLLSRGGQFACLYDSYVACFTNGSTTSRWMIFLRSFDPNDKTGPGLVTDHFINGDEPLSYVIRFENMESATAAAQKVVIIDTIDTSVFDIFTFEFEGYSFGKTFMPINEGLSNFTDILDLRPTHPNFLKVEGNIDYQSGVVKWEFLTLDTTTMQRTEHPLEGFLPPNVNSPEGEGMVAYNVHLRSDVQSGDILMNEASIYFDENAPIITNNWMNAFDDIKPESSVLPLSDITKDTTFTIEWEGYDNLSGIRQYDLIVIENDTLIYPVALGISETSTEFTGTDGSKYQFYTIATDSAGNVEIITGIDAETTIDMTTGQKKYIRELGIKSRIYPNPTSGSINIELILEESREIGFKIADIAGKVFINFEEKSFSPGFHIEQVRLENISPGIYFVTITSTGFTFTERIMVL